MVKYFTIYCQSAYPLSVNIEALQSQISYISNVKIILSTKLQAKSK